MDEGNAYCGSGGGIQSVSDAVKITNMVITGAAEGQNLCLDKDSVESNIKPRFLADRVGIMGMVVGREREGWTILEVCRGRLIRRNSVLEELRVR